MAAAVPSKKYCISPWTEGVLRLNNRLLPCCKNSVSFGPWKSGALKDAWFSDVAVQMRHAIVNGEFPDDYCRACYSNQTNNTAKKLLHKPLRDFTKIVAQYEPQVADRFLDLQTIFEKIEVDDEVENVLSRFREVEKQMRECIGIHPEEFATAVFKLGVVASILSDFLTGEVRPRHVAPLREANLIAVCNARCIHCPGKFTGEIERGQLLADGTIFTEMDRQAIDDSFVEDESIIDFFTNGSEFLFLKDWKYVAKRLAAISVKFRLSTNGMLITKNNIDYLVGNRMVGKFNISIDGATKNTIEYIRGRVKYDRLKRNVVYLFEAMERANFSVPLTFSFCLMKRNYEELPDFVDFIAEMRGANRIAKPNILVQPLSLKGTATYLSFLESEHHSLVPKQLIVRKFEQMLKRSKKHGIPVHVFYTHTLDRFLKLGAPLPALNVVNAKKVS